MMRTIGIYVGLWWVNACLGIAVVSAQEIIPTRAGLTAKGNDFYTSAKYVEAETVYRETITDKTADFALQYNLGNSLYQQQRYEEAVSAYQQAVLLAEEPTQIAWAQYNKGNALMQQVQAANSDPQADPQDSQQALSGAIQSYAQALAILPNDPMLRYNLAYALALQDQQQGQSDPPALPDPSAYALQLKARADQMVAARQYQRALNTMQEGLMQDSTVSHYQEFIQRLEGVAKIQGTEP